MTTYKGIQGYKIESLASDPPAPQTGQIWYNTTSTTMKVYGSSAAAGTWAAGGLLTSARYNPQGAGATSATALCIGGRYSPPAANLDNTESYNGSAWTEIADLNTAKSAGSGFGTQTSAICAGGNPQPGNTCESWNGSSWSEVSNTNTARAYLAESGRSATSGMIMGGSPYSVICEVWDGSSWTETADLNTGRTQFRGAAYAPTTDSLAFGGETPPYSALTESWNGTAWTEVADLNLARAAGGGSGVSSTDAMYFGGHIAAGDTNVANNELWNGTSWTEVNNMTVAKQQSQGSGTTSSAMYASGDLTTGSPRYTTTTEEFAAQNATQTFTAT